MSRKAYALVWAETALSDLEAIGEFIARDDPAAAQRWVRKLMATARATTRAPFGGRRVPEVGRDDVREVFLKRYRIVYRVSAASCEVLTVFEGHRLLRLVDENEAGAEVPSGRSRKVDSPRRRGGKARR